MAILALICGGLFGLLALSNAREFQVFGDIVARVETGRAVVALTFDDGPTPDHTQDVLEILAAQGVVGTFFLTGREVEANPAQARAIVAAGHEVGNHSWSHKRMVLMGPGEVAQEIERTDAAIGAIGYEQPLHFRPPYGKKLVVLPWYLAQNQRTTIMWDVEPEADAALADDPQAMADFVIETARPGSIVIMHVMYDSRETSRQALPLIIAGLRARGLEFVTVSELLAER